MTEPLTSLERQVYHYLLDFLAENTYQPSIREIAKRFQIKSTKTVSDLLHALEDKGYIKRDRSRSRGVRLVGYSAATGTRPVPYYGKVAAGQPSLLPEHVEGHITMDRRFLPGDDVFFMKIRGDSMVGRGIDDGDYIMVHRSEKATDGSMITARLGDEATVKTLRERNGRLVLEPANPAEQEIEVGPDDDFEILGVVCGVFRPFCDDAQPENWKED